MNRPSLLLRIALLVGLVAAPLGCGEGESRVPRTDEPASGSFRWAMKNPEARREMAETARREIERRRREESRELSPAEIRALVRKLEDPKIRACPPTSDPLEDLPIERILKRLQRYAPPEIVPRIADLAGHANSNLRGAVAAALGNVASDEALPTIRRLLKDPDEFVRTHAVRGIRSGIRAGRGSPEFRAAVFEELLSTLASGGWDVMGSVAPLLLELDRSRARAALLHDRVFRPDHPEIHRVIAALTADPCPIPLEKLRPMMTALRPKWAEYPESYAYGACLVALALARADDAEEVIRAGFAAPESHVVDSACHALLILHDLDRIGSVVSDRRDAVGFSEMAPHEQALEAVRCLEISVGSDGLYGFFGHGYGNLTSATLEALERVEAVDTLAVLREACALFGPKGPSDRYRRREWQVAKLTEKDIEKLGKLDGRFFRLGPKRTIRLTEWVLENREAFRRTLRKVQKK